MSETGDRRAAEWYRLLRLRFIDIARKRVLADDVEDVVQDALRVVHERGGSLPEERTVDGLPPLAWCFQVLRFTIANAYRKRDARREREDPAAEPDRLADNRALTPLESMTSREAVTAIREALRRMAETDPNCSRYLEAVMQGRPARRIAARDSLDEAVLYRRLYRCRQKLKALLRSAGVLP